jgi:hypothetical protein
MQKTTTSRPWCLCLRLNGLVCELSDELTIKTNQHGVHQILGSDSQPARVAKVIHANDDIDVKAPIMTFKTLFAFNRYVKKFSIEGVTDVTIPFDRYYSMTYFATLNSVNHHLQALTFILGTEPLRLDEYSLDHVLQPMPTIRRFVVNTARTYQWPNLQRLLTVFPNLESLEIQTMDDLAWVRNLEFMPSIKHFKTKTESHAGIAPHELNNLIRRGVVLDISINDPTV